MDAVARASFVLFNATTVLSFVSLLAIVSTAYFSKYVPRRNVWYGQKVQWMIYCVSYMLLFGFQSSEPPRALCLLQASLIYACPPACAVGSACFIIDFYMSLGPLHQLQITKPRRLELLLIILPWVTLVLAALHVILFVTYSGNMSSTQRSPGVPFCRVEHLEPTLVSAILVILATVVALYFEVLCGIIMHSNRQEFRRLKYKTIRRYLSLYIRSAILTVGMLIGIGISIYALSKTRGGLGSWSLSLPFMPLFVAIVFGTQRDIMRVWLFWRKRVPEEEDISFTSQISISLEMISVRNSGHLGT